MSYKFTNFFLPSIIFNALSSDSVYIICFNDVTL